MPTDGTTCIAFAFLTQWEVSSGFNELYNKRGWTAGLTMLLIGAPIVNVFSRVPSLISHNRTVPSMEAEYT